ncbi:MAG: hypothetical protein RMM51_05520 [Verrucomicrobiae bacterium]|nr:hypothetical protein [Verrucomicrobiae bacterium]
MNSVLLTALATALCSVPTLASVEVTRDRHTHNLSHYDEPIFGRDRVTYFRTAQVALPADQQAETFRITWKSPSVAAVHLSYRQLHVASVQQVSVPVSNRAYSANIILRSSDLAQRGPITAWRVTLLDAEGCVVAERKSALW